MKKGRNRQPIYVGAPLQAVLKGRKEPLSKVVSMLAERYTEMIERADKPPPYSYCMYAGMYDDVLREVGRPLTPKEIATFPAMCKDWNKRREGGEQEVYKTIIGVLERMSYVDLVALVDRTERQL